VGERKGIRLGRESAVKIDHSLGQNMGRNHGDVVGLV